VLFQILIPAFSSYILASLYLYYSSFCIRWEVAAMGESWRYLAISGDIRRYSKLYARYGL